MEWAIMIPGWSWKLTGSDWQNAARPPAQIHTHTQILVNKRTHRPVSRQKIQQMKPLRSERELNPINCVDGCNSNKGEDDNSNNISQGNLGKSLSSEDTSPHTKTHTHMHTSTTRRDGLVWHTYFLLWWIATNQPSHMFIREQLSGHSP